MKVLFVVTAFYPEQAIGSVRVTKFAKYLERLGVEVSIISLTPMPWASRDEGLYFDALDGMQWTTIDQSQLFKRWLFRARNAAVGNSSAVGFVRLSGSNKSIKDIIKSLAQFVYTILKALDWVGQVKRYARKNMENERYDLIFSSYPSFSSPFAARALARMGLSRNVMIDFRDPVSYGSTSRFSILRLLERRMLGKAQIASFVSEGVRDKVVGDDDSRARLIVINNGFDPEDATMIEESTRVRDQTSTLRFVYVGSLYGGKRDLRPFFKAAKLALEQDGFEQRCMELHYAGVEGSLFEQQANEYGLAKYVVNHGRVTRYESLALQKAADVCLLATWNTKADQGILTGKMFEFFMLRKPVLAVVNGDLPNSETKRVIDKVGCGFCFEQAVPEEMPEFQAWITAALREKVANGSIASHYNEAVDHYNFARMVEVMQDAVHKVVSSASEKCE